MKLSPLERILLGLAAVFLLGTALIFCFGNRSASVIVMTEPSSGAVLAASTQKADGQSQEDPNGPEPSASSAGAEESSAPEEPDAAAAARTEPTASAQPLPASPSPDPAETEQTDTQKINLNTATAEQLKTLPSIGDKRAEAILAYREEHGPFSKIEDIVKVSGIGRGIFSKIKPYLTVE
jgi:competence protein ComEA